MSDHPRVTPLESEEAFVRFLDQVKREDPVIGFENTATGRPPLRTDSLVTVRDLFQALQALR